MDKYHSLRILGLSLLMLVVAFVSLFVGVKEISPSEMLQWKDEELMLLSISRFPRTIALIITGIGISICGLVMQQMTQNKFVSPTTAGALDAAKLGILGTLILLPQENTTLKLLFAFGVTFLASLLFIKIADSIRYRSVVFIPIVGLLFGGIINSITSFFAYRFNIVQDVGATRDMTGSWLMGDFSGILQGNYEAVYLCLPAVFLTYVYASKFTVVGLGKVFSKNLGLNYRGVLNVGLFCVSLTISSIVVTVGIIPFLGLVIPNIVSLLFGDNLKNTLPYTALFGAIFLLICDIMGRLIVFPFEVPIGLMIGLVGGILFLILLIRKQ
nr:iron chelate uptake ABC transporter family permease subunit [Allomuricauda sp.]